MTKNHHFGVKTWLGIYPNGAVNLLIFPSKASPASPACENHSVTETTTFCQCPAGRWEWEQEFAHCGLPQAPVTTPVPIKAAGSEVKYS